MSKPGFWDDQLLAKEIIQKINLRKEWTSAWHNLEKQRREIEELIAIVEEDDEAGQKELSLEIEKLSAGIKALEFRHMLSGEDDEKDAILTIHPGAGGTESCDWAAMLLRMYTRWMERKGYQYKVIDFLPGEEAGLKSATVEVSGKYAYGYLKAEIGVHRLVRISPFDANKRRHTSFVSVFVYPEIEDTVKVEIDEKDLRIDIFRSGGKGGQNVNKVATAVRIVHLPTAITVQSQNERSQYQNRINAMRVLRARLYQYYKAEEEKKKQALEEAKTEIAWGNQIRSYVFHPYTMVKDHRTEEETGNIQSVMDGEIDRFIFAYLKKK